MAGMKREGGDPLHIAKADKPRAKSEPSSVSSWHAVLFGRHSSTHHDQRPQAVITASSLVMTAGGSRGNVGRCGQQHLRRPHRLQLSDGGGHGGQVSTGRQRQLKRC